MSWASLPRVLFIGYCLEVGLFLIMAPWSGTWDRVLFHLPFSPLYSILLHPAFRGGVSGFGLVHLVWGVHDLDRLLGERRAAEQALAEPP